MSYYLGIHKSIQHMSSSRTIYISNFFDVIAHACTREFCSVEEQSSVSSWDPLGEKENSSICQASLVWSGLVSNEAVDIRHEVGYEVLQTSFPTSCLQVS